MSNIVRETTSFQTSMSSQGSDELGRDDPIQEMLKEMSEHHQKILERHFRGNQDEMSRHYQQVLDKEYGDDDSVFPVAHYRPPQPGRVDGRLTENDGSFEINVDMKGYDPSEVCVKTVDNVIVVEGQHEEKRNGQNFVSRQFSRRYTLPPTVQPDAITSKLSSGGILSISAPKYNMIEGGRSHYNPQEVRRDSTSSSSSHGSRKGNNMYNTETKTDTKVTTRKESTISTEENHYNGDNPIVKHADDPEDPIRDMLSKMNTRNNTILNRHFRGDSDQMMEHYQKVVSKDFSEDPFIPIYARTLSRQQSSDQLQPQQQQPIIDQDHEYEISVDVSGYNPEEISVKTVDHSLTVECKHEENGGHITRQMTRKYQLPRSVDPLKITSNLSSDGLLVVKAPKKVQAIDLAERMVPISISDNQKSPRKESQYKSEIHVSCK